MVALVLLTSAAPAVRAGTPAATQAESMLAQASARAGGASRNVMVVFHASWCRWCRKLEALLAVPDVKRSIAANYEVIWVDVMERRDKTSLETPGGNELLARLGGGQGLPYVAFLSPKGEVLATSGQIGYPATPGEIAAFTSLLERTGPRFRPADIALIRERLAAR